MAATAPVLEVVLPRLVNDLVDQGDIVLVLDDFHRLSGPTARETVAWFVEHLPENVQLVISTRTDPALPLGTLRARGHLQELRADDLRFTAPEAAEFLNDRLALDLPDEDVEVLVARTDGWPAGLYLAALSLAGADDRPALVRAFDGTSAHIVDFLAAEVLAAHPPELQAFMLRTSVLERLCAPLCDAVLGGDGSRSALDTLARTNLFLVALDERRRWYRFHHLFAQILRVELERREPEVVPELHRRAFAWHRAAGTADEAIHHAVAAHAFVEAGDLIAGTWVHYANAGRAASVADWLARFPRPVLDADPRLLVVSAWIAALRGREAEMDAAAARARALGGLEDGPLPGRIRVARLEPLRAARHVRLGRRRGDRRGGRAVGDARGPGVAVAAGRHVGARVGALLRGDLAAAEAWLRETVVHRPGVRPVDRRRRGRRGPLAHRRDARRPRRADAASRREAAALARDRGLLDAVEDGEVHTALGVALAADGRLAEALPALERACSCAVSGASRSTSWTGCSPSRRPSRRSATASAPRRSCRGGGVVAACRDPGALPARLAEAERAAGVRPGRGPRGRERGGHATS